MTALPPNVVSTLASKATYTFEENPRIAFSRELTQAGFKPPRIITIGKLTRMDGPGDKKGRESGWAIYHEVNNDNRLMGIGVYGSWKGVPEKVTWCSRSMAAMSAYDRDSYNVELELLRKKREDALVATQMDAAIRAQQIYDSSGPGGHPYLDRKGVEAADGIRTGKGSLIIPVYDANGALTSLQFIKEDGDKKFLTGGKIKGGMFKIAGSGEVAYIVEGYATGASIHAATQSTVYIAFNAGNIYEVAAAVKPRHAQIVIAGDDDLTGRLKATQTSQALGIEVIYPMDGFNDFNDQYKAQGALELKLHLAQRPKVYQKRAELVEDDKRNPFTPPPGVLGDVATYYNATAGNAQPGFAIQCALALGSIITARNFETNYSNRSSLFLMNLGKSATGKEHSKRVLEKILEASGQGTLFAGDGYTSKGGVFSTLYDKPRHLTVIDEFSKYMAAAVNKNGNSNLTEANTDLMKIIAAPDGIHRAPNYSTIGMQDDKKKEMQDLKVINPAVTLLAMSTPEDLLKSINISSVKDGFYNRFVIFISDAQRSVREHKEPLEVPETILNWIRAINNRRGMAPDSPLDYPALVTLQMDTDAMEIAHRMEVYKVKRADELEKFSLAELPGRTAEMAQRIALILALSCDPQATEVNREHMEWAESWVKYNHTVLANRMKMSVSSSDFEARKLESLGAIREAGEQGLTQRQLVTTKPFSKYNARELKEVLDALQSAELVANQTRRTGAPGKPAMVWVGIE